MKRKKPPQKPPEGSAGAQRLKSATDDRPNEFDRAVSALFQVPKSAVDEAEATRLKRTRKTK